jgi:hypothetical protein
MGFPITRFVKSILTKICQILHKVWYVANNIEGWVIVSMFIFCSYAPLANLNHFMGIFANMCFIESMKKKHYPNSLPSVGRYAGELPQFYMFPWKYFFSTYPWFSLSLIFLDHLGVKV